MSFYKKHKKGIIGTIIFHVIVLLLLTLFGFFTPLPLPGEEGILVDFGDSEQGLGQMEPRPQQRQPEPAEPVQQQEETTPPPPPPATTPPATQPEQAEEEAMTQDYEETAAIDAAEKRRQEEEERQQRIEEERRRQQELEEQRQRELERERQAEIERQRQEELERQRQAELERQRQLEAERKRREEEQRRIEEINARAEGAFGGSEEGTTGQGTSDSQSQGATFPGGNQGVPTGDANAGNYGPGGSGPGEQGTGVSYNLSGRTPSKRPPQPGYPGDEEGVVIVRIRVDKYGNVQTAQAGVTGTTLIDHSFWKEVEKSALKAKFSVDENNPIQVGTITYYYNLK